MDNLLDKTGVKRLLSNIKNWAENKFIDAEDKVYEQWEIELLLNSKELKPGKYYKVNYNTNKYASYKNNIIFTDNVYTQYIILKAIDINEFDNEAVLLKYKNSNSYDRFDCKINIKKYNFVNNRGRNRICCIEYKEFVVYATEVINNFVHFKFPNSTIPAPSIYVSINDLNNINGYYNNIAGYKQPAFGTGVYDNVKLCFNGLGDITYLKDNNGNEAPFDFINLKINDKAIITGNNNIIKSFDSSSPIFIEGNDNFVDYDCTAINIIGNRNVVEKNCVAIEINGDDNYINYKTMDSSIVNSFDCRIGRHSKEVYIQNTFACNVGNYCAGVKTDNYCVGNNCYLIFYPKNHCDDNKCFDEFTNSPIRNFVIKKAEHLDIDNNIGDISNENIMIEQYQTEHEDLIVTILLKTGLITRDYHSESFYIEDSSGFITILTSFDDKIINGMYDGASVVKENDELCIKYEFRFNFNNYSLSSEDLDNIYLLIERKDDFYTTMVNNNYEIGITIR